MGKDNLFSLAGMNIVDTIGPYRMKMWDIASTKYGYTSHGFDAFDDPVRASVLTEEGMKVIRDDPLVFILAHTIGAGRVIAPFFPRLHKIIGRDIKTLSLLAYGIDFITMAFCLIGVVLSLKDRSAEKIQTVAVILMIIVIIYFALIPGIEGGTRFRVPILPYAAILSTLGIRKSVTLLKIRKGISRSG